MEKKNRKKNQEDDEKDTKKIKSSRMSGGWVGARFSALTKSRERAAAMGASRALLVVVVGVHTSGCDGVKKLSIATSSLDHPAHTGSTRFVRQAVEFTAESAAAALVNE